uniref:PBS lyase HEAT domain protein repeat-containing protein n=1 Tax=Rhodopseudomonas palustris (strain BisA53) TaxID=316055 RepID=Q07KH0_RHOP5
MPFIRRDPPSSKQAAPAADELTTQLVDLGSADPERRWRAARGVGREPTAVPALAAALAIEPSPRVREAIMTALMRIGDEASVRVLLPALRSQDASLRGAAIEALQALPDAIMPFMAALLHDTDSDVRILATELARNMPAADATHLLSELLEHEPHVNVCGAAIDVLAEVGTAAALPALQACATRFASTSFLPFAVSVAVARISGADTEGGHGAP